MCGIDVAADGSAVTVQPGQLEPFGLRVPGDISSAAFFFALAAARPEWRVTCPGLGLNPGRTGILMVLEAMGAGLQSNRATRQAASNRWAMSRCGAQPSTGS